jgi:hypothetical protein
MSYGAVLRAKPKARLCESNNILGSLEVGLGGPEGCKRVAVGRRDHRKESPLILSTLKGCETLLP